jgi:NitT/TauT family transport system permease protein
VSDEAQALGPEAAGRLALRPARAGGGLGLWLQTYGPSLLFALLVIVVWQVVQSRAGRAQFVLPTPETIGRTLYAERGLLLRNLGPTLLEAAGGFAIGNVLAILAAVVFVYSRPLEETFYPAAVALRSVPLIAITPLLVVWLGPGYASKIALTALITFFPTLVNMVHGLAAVEVATLELMYTLSASEWHVFWKVRVPYSLPYLFAALKIAPSASILGAIVAEFIGSTRGLGFIILQAMWGFNAGRLWAAMVVATLLSVAAFGLVVLLERLLIPWHAAIKQAGEE